MLQSILRPVAALAALAGLAAYATIMLRGPQGLNALAEKHRQIRLLQEQNDKLAHEIELKKDYIQRLKTDPATQEVALRRIDLVHPGDTLFKSADKSTQGAVGATATPGPVSGSK